MRRIVSSQGAIVSAASALNAVSSGASSSTAAVATVAGRIGGAVAAFHHDSRGGGSRDHRDNSRSHYPQHNDETSSNAFNNKQAKHDFSRDRRSHHHHQQQSQNSHHRDQSQQSDVNPNLQQRPFVSRDDRSQRYDRREDVFAPRRREGGGEPQRDRRGDNISGGNSHGDQRRRGDSFDNGQQQHRSSHSDGNASSTPFAPTAPRAGRPPRAASSSPYSSSRRDEGSRNGGDSNRHDQRQHHAISSALEATEARRTEVHYRHPHTEHRRQQQHQEEEHHRQDHRQRSSEGSGHASSSFSSSDPNRERKYSFSSHVESIVTTTASRDDDAVGVRTDRSVSSSSSSFAPDTTGASPLGSNLKRSYGNNRENAPQQQKSAAAAAAETARIAAVHNIGKNIPSTRVERWEAALRAFRLAPPHTRTPQLAFSTLEVFKQPIMACEYDEHKALRSAMRRKYGAEACSERHVGEDTMRARVAADVAATLQSSAAAAAAKTTPTGANAAEGTDVEDATLDAEDTFNDEEIDEEKSLPLPSSSPKSSSTFRHSDSTYATRRELPKMAVSERLEMQQAQMGNFNEWDEGDELLEYNPKTSALLEAFASFRLLAVTEEYGLTPFEKGDLYRRAITMLVEPDDAAMSRGHLKSTGETSNNSSNNIASKNGQNKSVVSDDGVSGAKALQRSQKLPPTSFVLQAIACISEAKLLDIPLTAGHYLPVLKCPLVAEIDKDLPMRLLADAATAVADTLQAAGRSDADEAAKKAVFRAQVAAAGTYAVTGNWQQAMLLCSSDPTFAALVKGLVDSNQWPWAYYLVSQLTAKNNDNDNGGGNLEQFLRSVSIAEAYSATAKQAIDYGMRVTFANANPIAKKISTSNRHETARIIGVTEGFSEFGGPVGQTREKLLAGQGAVAPAAVPAKKAVERTEALFDLGAFEVGAELSRQSRDTASDAVAAAAPLAEPVDPHSIKLYLDFSDPAACAYAVENSTKYAENQVAPFNCLPPKEVSDLYTTWVGLIKQWIESNSHHLTADERRAHQLYEEGGEDALVGDGEDTHDGVNSNGEAAEEGGGSNDDAVGGENASNSARKARLLLDQNNRKGSSEVYLHTPKFLTRRVIEPLILSAPPGRVLEALAFFPDFCHHYSLHVEHFARKLSECERLISECKRVIYGEGGGGGGRDGQRYGDGGFRDNARASSHRAKKRLRQLESDRLKLVAKKSELETGEIMPLGIIIRALHRSCEWRTILKFYCETFSVAGGGGGGGHHLALTSAQQLIDRFKKILAAEDDASTRKRNETQRNDKSAVDSSATASFSSFPSHPPHPTHAYLDSSLTTLLTAGVVDSGATAVDAGSKQSTVPLLPLRPNVFGGGQPWHPSDEAHVLLAIGQAILCSHGDVPDLSVVVRNMRDEAEKKKAEETDADDDGLGSLPLDRDTELILSSTHSIGEDKCCRRREDEDSSADDCGGALDNNAAPPRLRFTPADAIAFADFLPNTNSHKHMALLHILSRGGRGCPAGSHWERCVEALHNTDPMSNIFIDLFVWQMTACGRFHKGNDVFEDFMRRRKKRSMQMGSHHQHPKWPIFSYLMLSSSALRHARSDAAQYPAVNNSSLTTAQLQHQQGGSPCTADSRPVVRSAEDALLRLLEIGSLRVDAWNCMHTMACLLCAVIETPRIPEALAKEHALALACWREGRPNIAAAAAVGGGFSFHRGGGGAATTTRLGNDDDDADVLTLLGELKEGLSSSSADRRNTTTFSSMLNHENGNANANGAADGPLLPNHLKPITYRRIRRFLERQACVSNNGNSNDLQNAALGTKGNASVREGVKPLPTNYNVAATATLANEAIQKLLGLLRSGKLDAIRPQTQTEYNNLTIFFVKQVYSVVKYYAEIDHRDAKTGATTVYIHNHDDLRVSHMSMLRRFEHEVPAEELAIAPTVRERIQYRLDACAEVVIEVIKELAKRPAPSAASSSSRNNTYQSGGRGGRHHHHNQQPFSTTHVIATAVRKGLPLPFDAFLD